MDNNTCQLLCEVSYYSIKVSLNDDLIKGFKDNISYSVRYQGLLNDLKVLEILEVV